MYQVLRWGDHEGRPPGMGLVQRVGLAPFQISHLIAKYMWTANFIHSPFKTGNLKNAP
jgi:hypothetical protein